jgi:hypothetical protein
MNPALDARKPVAADRRQKSGHIRTFQIPSDLLKDLPECEAEPVSLQRIHWGAWP